MRIELDHIGKRYNRHWIFKDINLSLRSEEAYVVLGANGSGKSTLLQILAGSLLASEGRISYFQGTNEIAADRIYRSVSIVAPYIDLIDSYTVKELIDFQFQFKSFYRGVTPDAILELINLRSIQSKPLKEFSSGMRQRIKLALAIFSDSSLLLLDEPTNNLDPASRDEILAALSEYQGAVVMVTHDVGAVVALKPERVLLLPDGDEDLWNDEYFDLIALE